MAENYKHLYHQMKKMVEQYQDVIVPGLRERLGKRVEVVRCKDCWKRHDPYECPMCSLEYGDYTTLDGVGFCDQGERRTDGNNE